MNVRIRASVYPFDVAVSMGESDKDFARFLRRVGKMTPKAVAELDMGVSETVGGRCMQMEHGQVIIRTYSIPNTALRTAVLAHEIFHATVFIMDKAGIKLSDSSDEAFAYMLTHITETVYGALYKAKKL